jgi:peptide/nickel transport system substrate-binding protein
VEWAQWLERVFRGHDYDLTIVSHTEPHDIGIYARPDYYFGYDNPEMGALMARLRAAPDTAGRNAILAEAQAIIARDQVNAFLFQLARTGVADARLRGLWANAPVQANDLTGVYWAE